MQYWSKDATVMLQQCSNNRRHIVLILSVCQVQNRIDDIAMAFERLHAMVTGQDPLATALFFWRCLIGATGKQWCW
jgi:hypothetical protein